MRITSGPWRYEYGEVVSQTGETIATRSCERSRNTSPVQRDTDLAAVALLPELRDALAAMLQAYAPRAEWCNPEALHPAVKAAGEVLAKLAKIEEDSEGVKQAQQILKARGL